MSAPLLRFLRLLCVLDGRNRREILAIVGGSTATFKRDLQAARGLGVRVVYDAFQGVYRMPDGGPFDVRALRRARMG